MFTCTEVTIAFGGKCGFGFQFGFCPVQQLRQWQGAFAEVLDSRLKDYHPNLYNVIEGIEQFQRSKSIQHHLRVVVGGYRHALAILEVDDR